MFQEGPQAAHNLAKNPMHSAVVGMPTTKIVTANGNSVLLTDGLVAKEKMATVFLPNRYRVVPMTTDAYQKFLARDKRAAIRGEGLGNRSPNPSGGTAIFEMDLLIYRNVASRDDGLSLKCNRP